MSNTVRLTYPVIVKGETYEELSLRRPKMRDLKKAQACKSDMDKAITIIADLADVPPSVIEELDPTDFKALSEIVGEYTGDAAGTAP